MLEFGLGLLKINALFNITSKLYNRLAIKHFQ
jgi:hypothetical protein